MTLQELMALSQDPRIGEIRQGPYLDYGADPTAAPTMPTGWDPNNPSPEDLPTPERPQDPNAKKTSGNPGLDWAAVLMQLGSAVAAAIAASKQKRQKTLIAVS
jgi:hypothetical protein